MNFETLQVGWEFFSVGQLVTGTDGRVQCAGGHVTQVDPSTSGRQAALVAPLTVFVVVAPDLHELIGREFLQLTTVRIAELAHEIGAPIQIDFGDALLSAGCHVLCSKDIKDNASQIR